jgi:hypothetical protein
MEQGNITFGGGLAHTIFSPIVGFVVLIAVLFICFSPRSKAIIAFLAVALLIPPDQILVLGSLHFPVLRILALFGFARILCAKFTSGSEVFSGGMNGIDKAVILLVVFTVIDGALLWQETAEVIYQLGNLYTVFGVYFLLRFLIRTEEDVQHMFRVFIYIVAVIAVFMAYERVTGTNLIYGLLGGARSDVLGTAIQRDDKFRATGPFGHPILAGTFGAVLLPLFVGLWLNNKQNRKIALVGIIASIVVTVSGNSSTALLGMGAGLLALCMWPLRKMMRPIRWGIVLTLVFLQIVMKNPVWHLIERIDVVGNSSSYHRYELVNQCILHFTDWMFIGTKSYADWAYDMWDLSNQYVAIAETAGLIPLIAFFVIIVLGFKYLGKARNASDGDKSRELFLWAMGSAMFANVVAYFGTSYWDQSIVSWYGLLAAIPVAAAAAPKPVPQAEIKVVRPGLVFHRPLAPNSVRGRLSN